jgi:hypothetical protein
MIFNGTEAWFVPPTSKYGLNKIDAKDIQLNDFTFTARIKIDWDYMVPDTNTQEAGIMIKNGRHLGLSIAHTGHGYKLLKGMLWTKEIKTIAGTDKPFVAPKPEELIIPLNSHEDISNDYINVALSVNLSEKKFTLTANQFSKTQSFENELIDYSSSWLWVGCANALDSCPDDHKQYFKGDVEFCGIFQKYMDFDETQLVFDGKWDKNYKPVGVYDFKNLTPYKALDITKNGNNLIKYDITWMEHI